MIDPATIALANIASTLFMAGIIWFIQLVHYPLFDSVGQSGFAHYELQHTTRTTWIVAPAMLIEALSSMMLIWVRPTSIGIGTAFAGVLLVGLIWGSTFTMQIPLHVQLSTGFEATAHRTLLATNWVRTVAWTLRAWLALYMILQLGAPAL